MHQGTLGEHPTYVLSPEDELEGGVYGVPNGDIDTGRLNGNVAILDIGPKNDGIGKMRFLERVAATGSKSFESYGWGEEGDMYGGYLVGVLGREHFGETYSMPDAVFPIRNGLEVVYPCGNEGGRELVVKVD